MTTPTPTAGTADDRALEDRPQTLYRFYDASGTLLYVGITVSAAGRWQRHSWDKPWWADVATCTVEHHPNRAAALAAERAAINAERPVHNVQHNGMVGSSRQQMSYEDSVRQAAAEGRLYYGDSDCLVHPEDVDRMLEIQAQSSTAVPRTRSPASSLMSSS